MLSLVVCFNHSMPPSMGLFQLLCASLFGLFQPPRALHVTTIPCFTVIIPCTGLCLISWRRCGCVADRVRQAKWAACAHTLCSCGKLLLQLMLGLKFPTSFPVFHACAKAEGRYNKYVTHLAWMTSLLDRYRLVVPRPPTDGA